jgi:ribonuclease HII
MVSPVATGSLVFSQEQPDGDTFFFERQLLGRGFNRIAGTDEVGRGPLAGPVVAAAVILPPEGDSSPFLDSKVLSHRKRLQLYDCLRAMDASLGIGIVAAAEIDRINILQASLLAMRIALDTMNGKSADALLVDGRFPVPVEIPQLTLVRGESKSASIAAASIAAKLSRDRLMVEMHELYPHYNFARNKGYPTREHREAIAEHGICPIHRRTFKGVRQYV